MKPIETEDFSNLYFSDLANAERYPFEEIKVTGKEVTHPSVQKNWMKLMLLLPVKNSFYHHVDSLIITQKSSTFSKNVGLCNAFKFFNQSPQISFD